MAGPGNLTLVNPYLVPNVLPNSVIPNNHPSKMLPENLKPNDLTLSGKDRSSGETNTVHLATLTDLLFCTQRRGYL